MPQILILRIIGLFRDLQRDIVGLCIGDLLLSGVQLPETPGSDHIHLRGKGLDGQLKADLVIPLSRTAVADGIGPLLFRDLNNALGDQRAGKGGPQQVILISRSSFHCGNDILLHEFLLQILDIQLGSACF